MKATSCKQEMKRHRSLTYRCCETCDWPCSLDLSWSLLIPPDLSLPHFLSLSPSLHPSLPPSLSLSLSLSLMPARPRRLPGYILIRKLRKRAHLSAPLQCSPLLAPDGIMRIWHDYHTRSFFSYMLWRLKHHNHHHPWNSRGLHVVIIVWYLIETTFVVNSSGLCHWHCLYSSHTHTNTHHHHQFPKVDGARYWGVIIGDSNCWNNSVQQPGFLL